VGRDDEARLLREKIRRDKYRYFIGHLDAAEMWTARRRESADALMARRRAFVETVLGGELVHEDPEREVYKFW
jgi:hypothetical protein